MNEDRLEPSTSSSSSSPSPTNDSSPSSLRLRCRREPFEYGLLPLPKLIFADGTQTLVSIKKKFFDRSSPPSNRVDAPAVAEILHIPIEHATLALDTLASVLPSDDANDLDVGAEGTVDMSDLLLFLYIQTYRRLLPKTHKDSAAVADVWPSTSAFDGYLSALSPLQLVRSNSRRFLPSQADEEAHQLSYLQKHMANMLALLAEPVEREGDEFLVLSSERFEHLGFLIQFCEKGCEGIPLSQAVPFFTNSGTDMPAIPVPAAEVQDWVLQNIASSLEHTAEKLSAKESGPSSASDLDVNMADGCTNTSRGQSGTSPIGISIPTNASFSISQNFVEGISKASFVKQASDIKGSSVKVLNCHESVIYILAPLRYATIYGCSDATIVLGAIGKALRVEHCERVQVITAAKRISIANCRECVFYLGVNQRPVILGDNHKLLVAPYNTFYSQLNEHMTQVGVITTINRWNEPLVLGMVDPHDSLSHPAGVSDVQAESATCLEPDQFNNFLIPNWFGTKTSNPTKDNPFPLPEIYVASQKKHHLVLNDILQAIRDVQIEENRKRELACALHVHFKDWLYASGNIRQLYCLQCD